jgi:hypothetical protein
MDVLRREECGETARLSDSTSRILTRASEAAAQPLCHIQWEEIACGSAIGRTKIDRRAPDAMTLGATVVR